MSHTIRDYRDGDLEAVLEAWEAASRIAHSFLGKEFLREERDRVAYLFIPNAEILVIEAEARVVGFAALLGNEIGGLFVRPDFHRRGLGRALVDRIAGRFDEMTLEVFARNDLGRRFYTGYGFVETGRKPHPETGEVLIAMRFRHGGS